MPKTKVAEKKFDLSYRKYLKSKEDLQDRNETLQYELKNFNRNYALVHVYFKELGIVKFSRNELYGPIDVIGKWFMAHSVLCHLCDFILPKQ